ncbi:hypothetical protein Ccrd_022430 [Cynara cardunculus var. scolymus]|uniref:Uncharacterized protein n=1 Tax=Cynara cardunculus var. scolymus TaxID=59895 RepID=A0A118JZ08_CYNCS|nr:hypothetical protein Ccrd_022430 [Cynara cardunculus var. scolymus]
MYRRGKHVGFFDVATRQTRLLIKSKIFSSSMFIAFQEVRNSHEDSLAEINGIGDRRSEGSKLEFMFSNMNIHKLRLLSTLKTILF